MTYHDTVTRDERARARFAHDVVEINDRFSFRHLPTELTGPPVYLDESADGLVTIVVRDRDLPHRYLLGIHGFRLAQCVRRGWVNDRVLCDRGLFREPLRPPHKLPDYHTIVLDARSGRIRGYACLVSSADPAPLPLDDPRRVRFVVERDYDIDITTRLIADVANTHEIFEAKRLLRDHAMPRSAAGRTIAWRSLLGFAHGVLHSMTHTGTAVTVGDGKVGGSIHSLRLLGFDVEALLSAEAEIAENDLFWPMFQQEVRSKPFILRDSPTLRPTLEYLRALLDGPEDVSIRSTLEALAQHRGETHVVAHVEH